MNYKIQNIWKVFIIRLHNCLKNVHPKLFIRKTLPLPIIMLGILSMIGALKMCFLVLLFGNPGQPRGPNSCLS